MENWKCDEKMWDLTTPFGSLQSTRCLKKPGNFLAFLTIPMVCLKAPGEHLPVSLRCQRFRCPPSQSRCGSWVESVLVLRWSTYMVRKVVVVVLMVLMVVVVFIFLNFKPDVSG